ncbi:M56 family metallopeptidase [Prevotella sp.]|uniref:M56 family metallopeptidase n=1 Tax=Prevotella sp. TaxID=59823 RepID=UPI0025ED2FEB|nr:M56 family metallopeptidase [Prevotella sp.]MCI7371071.1 M56 family metallopeptidase [Prevotella sp.]
MILPYIIKSAMALALLYTCIIPLLEKETFHRLNRILILGCLIMSFAIPLVHFTGGTNPTVDMVRQAVQLPEVLINGNASEQSVWSWADIMTCIYIIGVVAIFTMTVVQTVRLTRQLRQCEHITDNRGNTIVLTDCATSPFCLFHYIVMSRDDYANNRSYILTHEQEHIRLGHSIDLIILQFATIIQWFNPFVWLIGKNLKAIHEFEVDEAVLNKGIDATQYQKFLVIKAVGNRLQPFANNLNKESLKRRIIMMNQKKSNRWMMLKALFVIPVATLAVSVFANGTDVSNMAKETTPTAAALSTTNMQTQKSDKKIFRVVEEMPKFKGGDAKLMELLMMNMKYPESAIKAKQQGRAIVGFVVRKDGTVSDVYIEKSTGYDVLDNEAMRVVKSMPAWEPGKQKGKPVNVKYFVPITFSQK